MTHNATIVHREIFNKIGKSSIYVCCERLYHSNFSCTTAATTTISALPTYIKLNTNIFIVAAFDPFSRSTFYDYVVGAVHVIN